MKKLITACAAVMMAVVANAAAVSWNSGTYAQGFTNPDGEKMTTAMNFDLVVSVFSDAAGTTLVTSKNSKTVSAMTGAISAVTDDVLDGDKTYYIQAVISDGTNASTTDIYAFTTPTTGNAIVNFTTGGGLTGATGNTWGAWGPAGTPEPEPTSALMMLFGLAGLALRRKRA